ncbi:MAG: hypothetical protein M0006_05825 [Magnetospirillum sp.]|nr:hypothetical protein [Magnetospirillum sp.]
MRTTLHNRNAIDIAAGSFVAATIAGRRTLCLKVDRVGKEHTNHYLVPLDPVDDRRSLALVYIDPEDEMTAVDGISFAFADEVSGFVPEVGDAFSCAAGVFLKVIDDPQSQRMHAYVDIATGMLRARMDRHAERILSWSVSRI